MLRNHKLTIADINIYLFGSGNMKRFMGALEIDSSHFN